MNNWMFKFKSNKQVHGIRFAADRACKAGIPLSLVISSLRKGLI